MVSNMGGRGSSSGKQVKYNGKQIYVRKNESVDDAIKRYETKQSSSTPQRVPKKRVSIFEAQLGKAANLQGTQKQISWAESIREKMVDKLKNSATYEKQKIEDKYQRRLKKAEEDNPYTTRASTILDAHYVDLANRKYKEAVSYAKKEYMKETRQLTENFTETLGRIKKTKNATWFIDRRMDSGNELMREKRTARERMPVNSVSVNKRIRKIMSKSGGKRPTNNIDTMLYASKLPSKLKKTRR